MNPLFITIANHPNYEINQFGQVRNLKTGKFLSGFDIYGVKKIRFTEGCKQTQSNLNKLILYHFFPIIEGQCIDACYINGKDNTAENIKIYNVDDAIEKWVNSRNLN